MRLHVCVFVCARMILRNTVRARLCVYVAGQSLHDLQGALLRMIKAHSPNIEIRDTQREGERERERGSSGLICMCARRC